MRIAERKTKTKSIAQISLRLILSSLIFITEIQAEIPEALQGTWKNTEMKCAFRIEGSRLQMTYASGIDVSGLPGNPWIKFRQKGNAILITGDKGVEYKAKIKGDRLDMPLETGGKCAGVYIRTKSQFLASESKKTKATVSSEEKAIRIWTYEQIEKTGLPEKCEEIEKLRDDNFITKADNAWKAFEQSHPSLFEENSEPPILLELPGYWKATIEKTGYSTAAKIECADEFNPSCRGENFQYDYDISDREFPRRLRENFEQAAHDEYLLENVQLALPASIFKLVRCEIKAQIGYGNPTLYSFKASKKKSSDEDVKCQVAAESDYKHAQEMHKMALEEAQTQKGQEKEKSIKDANEALNEATQTKAIAEKACKNIPSEPKK